MTTRLILIAILGCFALPSASAATFKCKTPEGRTVFQDIPCAPEATTESIAGGQQMAVSSSWIFERRNDGSGKTACTVISPTLRFGSRYRPVGSARVRVDYTKDSAVAEVFSIAQPDTPSMPFHSNLEGVGIHIPGQAFLADVHFAENGALRFGPGDSARLVKYLISDDKITVRIRHLKSDALYDSTPQKMEGFPLAQQLAKDCVTTLR